MRFFGCVIVIIDANGSMDLEVGVDGKAELVYKNLLEWRDIILLIKQQHRFFIIDTVNSAERDGAIPICYKNGIACNTCYAFITIVECLDVGKQHEG